MGLHLFWSVIVGFLKFLVTLNEIEIMILQAKIIKEPIDRFSPTFFRTTKPILWVLIFIFLVFGGFFGAAELAYKDYKPLTFVRKLFCTTRLWISFLFLDRIQS